VQVEKCLRNLRTKNYQDLIMILKIVTENVQGFLGHSVYTNSG